MSTLLALAVVMVVLIGLTHALDQRRQDEVRRRMDGIFTRRGQDTLDEIDLIVRENKLVLASYYTRAEASRAQGRHGEAAERLARGCRAIEALAPDFLTALRALRELARTVSAVASVEPVSSHRLRRAESRTLATIGAALHHMLLTGRQQVVLRLHVIGAIFRLALRALLRSGRRIEARPRDERAWSRVGRLVQDLGVAGDDAVLAARSIVRALDAVELGYATTHDVRF